MGCLLFFESVATFFATAYGVIGGKTVAYCCLAYGAPALNVGLTMALYGDDYGRDPRCFIGWENATKNVSHLLITVCLNITAIVGTLLPCL